MKILHLISDLRRGGRERQLAILVHYSKPGIEHHVLTFHSTKNNYLNEYSITNFKILPADKLNRFRELYKYAKSEKINLIHTWGNSETLYALPVSKFLNIPLLNGSIRHGIRLKTFNHLFRSFILKRSKYILGNSRAGFEANGIRVNDKRHFVMYNGLEEKFFVMRDYAKRKVFTDNYNISNDSNILISVANFIPFKDYFTPLKAIKSLITEGYKLHYIIIGNGPMKEEISEYIKKNDLGKNVSIFSDKPDIPFLLSTSDIFVHSSLGEGCSNAILEAKAAGLRVVASDTGGTKEIVDSYDYLYEYKNDEDLKSKLVLALNLKKDKTIQEIIQNNSKEKFSVDSLLNSYNNILDIVTKRNN